MTLLSCLIPLYRSQPFFEIICDNIDAHLAQDDVEILLSDRHGLDDTAARLAARYDGMKRVRVLTAQDGDDWVANINGLMTAARGKYLRIIPHDDSAPAASSLRMVAALESNRDAVLAYGVVRGVDLNGAPMPQHDQLNTTESATSTEWTLDDALGLFWCGRFAGSFKGVVRADVIRSLGLLIRKTRTLVCSERTWLFALALTGRFQFVPDAVLVKRYYAGSTSSTWHYTPQVFADAMDTMMGYCDALILNAPLRDDAKRNLAVNGGAHIAAMETGGPRPPYRRFWETRAC